MSTWKIVWIKGKDTFHYIGTNRPKYVKNVHWYRSAVLHPYKLTYKPLNNWKKKIQLYFPQFPIKNRLPLTKLYYLNEYKNILYLFKLHNIIFHIYIFTYWVKLLRGIFLYAYWWLGYTTACGLYQKPFVWTKYSHSVNNISHFAKIRRTNTNTRGRYVKLTLNPD